MKIAVVAPLVAPIGGAEPYGNHALLVDLASGLARRGHRVRVYAAQGSYVPGIELVEIAVDERAQGAFIHADRPRSAPIPGMRESFERLFRRLRADGADAVSQHAFDAEAIELATGLPVLHTLHMPPIVPAVVRACRESRAPLVAVSEFAAAQWRAAGADRVLSIRNGVPDFAPLSALVRPVAIIAGRICREKGTAAAVRAALAAGLHAHIVGAVYDPVYFQREVAPLLGARVRLQACLPRRELWQLMAQSALCLLPIAWDEPYGLVAAEAQVAGCPVVGYARAALPELVEQEVSGILVPPGDEPALARAAREALKLDRHRVRASGRARLLLAPMVERYEAELLAALERSRGPRAPVIELASRSRDQETRV
jgi:glycosyltransferase involved in cell wall biosynthesis